MRRLRFLCLIAAAGTLAACASSSGATNSRNDDIVAADLVDVSANDAMEVVTLLRPQWLRARPARTPGSPVPVVGVVVDGRPRSTRADLAQIPAAMIERMSFMSAADATIRYGTGFSGGAIIVTTKR